MRIRSNRTALFAAIAASFIVLVLDAKPTRGQGLVTALDDVLAINKGKQAQLAARQKAGASTALGPLSPGGLAIPATTLGGPAMITGGSISAFRQAQTGGVLAAAAGYNTAFIGRQEHPQINPVKPSPIPSVPQYGTLELPQTDDEGPADGLTLDVALDYYVHNSPDLAAKFRELPKAEADVLTAGLLPNPIMFTSFDNIPYGQNYSTRRPGEVGYSITLAQPIDVSGKRKYRKIVAHQARHVLEAQYQEAVRTGIDSLGTAFVDALEMRENVRYKQANLERLDRLVKVSREVFAGGEQDRLTLDRFEMNRDAARVELDQAFSYYRQALRALATLLNYPADCSDRLGIRGSLRDEAPTTLSENDLINLALLNRPDLVALRLETRRVDDEVKLSKRERFDDVYLFYTPYGFNNYAPQRLQSATSWSVGALVSIPLFNLNQGNIARNRETSGQVRLQLSAQERIAIGDVQRAYEEYMNTLRVTRDLESSLIPRARVMREKQFDLYKRGGQNVVSFFDNAERDYNDVVRQYRDALIRHRRAMLKLNTAVGQRILP